MKHLYRIGHSLVKALLKAFFHFRVYGQENIPSGKAIIAANHQSYVDPPVVGSTIPEEIWYLAREDVFNYALFRWLCVRVNAILIRKRRAHGSALKAILEKLAQGRKALIFPEGTRSYDGQLQTPERGIGLLAHQSRAPVIPAYVSGTHRVLPRGGGMIHLHPISVSFGPQLRFDEHLLRAGAKRAYDTFSRQVMDAIARIKASLEGHPVNEAAVPPTHRES